MYYLRIITFIYPLIIKWTIIPIRTSKSSFASFVKRVSDDEFCLADDKLFLHKEDN